MSKKRLKIGFSTGTAAAAAAKAALKTLLNGVAPAAVEVSLPDGGELTVPIKWSRVISGTAAEAAVIKDAGDDPDVTHGAEIRTSVALLDSAPPQDRVLFRAGRGVGRVTRPGLPLPVGEPAINPTPRKMIEQALSQVWEAHKGQGDAFRAVVEISVPDGERLAKRTLNPRLGIIGGISILGTSGLVRPFSHEAYTATIDSGLSVAQASGLKEVVLTTGGKSEKWAMRLRLDLPETAFIQMADFFGYALTKVKESNFTRVGLVSFFGKAVKQAQGLDCTHAAKAPLDLDQLAGWFREAGAEAEVVRSVASANTARQALEILRLRQALHLTAEVGRRLVESCRKFTGPEMQIWVNIIDYDGTEIYSSPEAEGEA